MATGVLSGDKAKSARPLPGKICQVEQLLKVLILGGCFIFVLDLTVREMRRIGAGQSAAERTQLPD